MGGKAGMPGFKPRPSIEEVAGLDESPPNQDLHQALIRRLPVPAIFSGAGATPFLAVSSFSPFHGYVCLVSPYLILP